jgi:hypothetical protein
MDPWVIEINLSPACSERQPWLTKMLDDSALDMMNYLQSRILGHKNKRSQYLNS